LEYRDQKTAILQEVEQPFTLYIRVQRKVETQKVHVYRVLHTYGYNSYIIYEKVKSGDDIVKSCPQVFSLAFGHLAF